MKVAAIWRYPVKSMAGERLASIPIDINGLSGDRVVQVYDRRGRLVTARKYPRLLRLKAAIGSDGEPLVDGFRWDTGEAAERVAAAVEPGARLQRFDGALTWLSKASVKMRNAIGKGLSCACLTPRYVYRTCAPAA